MFAWCFLCLDHPRRDGGVVQHSCVENSLRRKSALLNKVHSGACYRLVGPELTADASAADAPYGVFKPKRTKQGQVCSTVGDHTQPQTRRSPTAPCFRPKRQSSPRQLSACGDFLEHSFLDKSWHLHREAGRAWGSPKAGRLAPEQWPPPLPGPAESVAFRTSTSLSPLFLGHNGVCL